MTDRQRRFLEALLSGPRSVRSNATRAAEAAGYAWPGKQGPRLMTHPEIAEAIRIDLEEHRERLFERTRAEADRFWWEVEALKAEKRRARRRRGECRKMMLFDHISRLNVTGYAGSSGMTYGHSSGGQAPPVHSLGVGVQGPGVTAIWKRTRCRNNQKIRQSPRRRRGDQTDVRNA